MNADKTKYMVISQDRNTRRSHDIEIENSSFERMEELKYLGTTSTNQSSIQEEIKSRLKSGMFSITRCRIFCIPICYLKIQKLRYTEV